MGMGIDPCDIPASMDGVVNAILVASNVLMQKSIRAGFGPTVTEGMWKGKPVIGGDAAGIRVQIDNDVSGFLVSSPEECAQRPVELLKGQDLSTCIGEDAKEKVRQMFLLTRLALDYLKVVRGHVGGGFQPPVETEPLLRRRLQPTCSVVTRLVGDSFLR